MSAFDNWDVALLRSMGLPVTKANRQFLQTWQHHEGGNAAFNPLNTTQGMPGATDYNSIHVRNYGSANQGLQATMKTLQNGYYPAIVAALQSGNPHWSPELGQNLSTWGTGSSFMKGYKGNPVTSTTPSSIQPNTTTSHSGSPYTVNPSADFRTILLNFLMGQVGHGAPSPSNLLFLAQARKAMGTAEDTFGPPQGLRKAPVAPQKGSVVMTKGTVGGLAEAFYDPLGSYDNGRFGKAIGGHSDHVHLSITNPKSMLQAITTAQRMGLRVGENPYIDKVDPVHVPNSFHYRDFPGLYGGKKLGQAIDVSGNPKTMAAFYEWATRSLR